MAYVSLRMTDPEKGILDSYAKLHGITVSEAVKTAIFERIEDEFDIAAVNEYIDKEAKGKVKYYTLDEAEAALGINQ